VNQDRPAGPVGTLHLRGGRKWKSRSRSLEQVFPCFSNYTLKLLMYRLSPVCNGTFLLSVAATTSDSKSVPPPPPSSSSHRQNLFLSCRDTARELLRDSASNSVTMSFMNICHHTKYTQSGTVQKHTNSKQCRDILHQVRDVGVTVEVVSVCACVCVCRSCALSPDLLLEGSRHDSSACLGT
jgi:hypothetical protein